ncbi:conserved Plasmodium membrane protein, unknown function [Plasmodium reichenowi]|uniref:Putative membrane protein n=1 Tax=Plasmodium reichenowi TaxID=5854 RepID=A0A060RWL7_PLARE|nr:putative membrane protein [Plasmodium reichenowi]KYN95582.1 putative membrane protein [Plasmodium reichenowi]CDO65755.1 conserved Plasmodium membrane protein, unknown function [Plasmodium reichenowi]
MTFLKFIYLIVVPLGIFLLLSCLLKVRFLVTFSYSFCRKKIGDTPLRIVSIILFLNFLIFITESYKLKYNVRNMYSANELITGITSDHLKLYKWRHERNWWIGLSNLCIWIMIWRSTGIINYYVKYLEQRKRQIKLL